MLILKDFNKLILKEIVILIPKFKENMLSFLAPIIGVYGIKVNLFIEEFEKKTEFLDFDVIVSVKVIIYKINTFDLFINLPYVNYYLDEMYNNCNILYLYKLSFVKSLLNFDYIKINYKLIRGYINSLQKIKNKFKLLKYKYYNIKNINNFKNLKLLKINFLYKINFLKYKYGIFLKINNLNTNIIKNINIIKVKKKFNIYLLNFNNMQQLLFFFNNSLLKNLKNRYKILYFKYKNNSLSLNFFNKFINEKYNILNLKKILFNIFYLFFFYKFNFNIFNIIENAKLSSNNKKK